MNLLKNAPKFQIILQNVQNVHFFDPPCAFHVLFRGERRKINSKFLEMVLILEILQIVQDLR